MKTEINVNLSKRSDFYNTYSNRRINKELQEYIYEECLGEPVKNKIIININTKLKLSKNEKYEMIDAIRRTYGLQVQDELYYYNKGQVIRVILLLLGFIFIIIYYSSIVSILKEIILILGWLAIWESIYSFLFDAKKNNLKIMRLKNLSNARIYFNEKLAFKD